MKIINLRKKYVILCHGKADYNMYKKCDNRWLLCHMELKDIQRIHRNILPFWMLNHWDRLENIIFSIK